MNGSEHACGVAHGTLQLPPEGQLILLGVDRQTTGGYPVLGTVASIDHPRQGQLRPGNSVRFQPIAVEKAQALYQGYHQSLARLQTSLSLRWPLNRQRISSDESAFHATNS
jgi:antagonist of KipI